MLPVLQILGEIYSNFFERTPCFTAVSLAKAASLSVGHFIHPLNQWRVLNYNKR